MRGQEGNFLAVHIAMHKQPEHGPNAKASRLPESEEAFKQTRHVSTSRGQGHILQSLALHTTAATGGKPSK